MRAGDTVYRTGGEEFSVLLPGLEAGRAGAVAERLRRIVAGIACPLPVTLSVGIASFPRDATGRDELVQKADAALYASKHSGKNRTTLASASAPAAAEARSGALDLRALHERDAATVVHSAHVANLAVETGARLGLTGDRLALLRTAARLHDVGKVAVPTAIVVKPGPLTAAETALVRTHPLVGAELARAAGHDAVARFIREHHENVDGTGYPAGLRGAEIALESRILRAVDAYLAMTLDRPYRAALPPGAAADELRRCAGGDFDPAVVDALLGVLADRERADDVALAYG